MLFLISNSDSDSLTHCVAHCKRSTLNQSFFVECRLPNVQYPERAAYSTHIANINLSNPCVVSVHTGSSRLIGQEAFARKTIYIEHWTFFQSYLTKCRRNYVCFRF